MRTRPRYLAHAAVLAALYAALAHFQNMIAPGTASWAIQLRMAEVLCVLAFFTPAAAPGLALGCLIFNLTLSSALPLDFLLGTAATFLSARGMWLTRRLRILDFPLAGMLLPALCNGLLVGWELSVYIGGGFLLNALYVALGEIIVLLGPGSGLYCAMKKRHLDRRLFFV